MMQHLLRRNGAAPFLETGVFAPSYPFFMSFRFFELPTSADTGTGSVERPRFLSSKTGSACVQRERTPGPRPPPKTQEVCTRGHAGHVINQLSLRVARNQTRPERRAIREFCLVL
jgi:hypothetical protein